MFVKEKLQWVSKSYHAYSFKLHHSIGIYIRRQTDNIFLIFSHKIGFDISYKLEDSLQEMSKAIFW